MGKSGVRAVGGSKAELMCAEEFLRLGAEARSGKRAAREIWGRCPKGEVGLEMGAGSRGSGHGRPSQSSRRGFWSRAGREIRRRSQLP